MLFVTGIGTEVGKTVISAMLTEALHADYWKPVQAGDLERSDTIKVKKLVSNPKSVFHPEAFRLKMAASPHAAAARENLHISLDKMQPPKTENTLVIEGAGGLMVPLNENEMMVDLIERLQAEVVLVSRNYLGSINHTLISCELLKSRNLKVKGIIFNGPENKPTEEVILSYSGFKCLGKVRELSEINPSVIKELSKTFEGI